MSHPGYRGKGFRLYPGITTCHRQFNNSGWLLPCLCTVQKSYATELILVARHLETSLENLPVKVTVLQASNLQLFFLNEWVILGTNKASISCVFPSLLTTSQEAGLSWSPSAEAAAGPDTQSRWRKCLQKHQCRGKQRSFFIFS